jgi:hypothetical protein
VKKPNPKKKPHSQEGAILPRRSHTPKKEPTPKKEMIQQQRSPIAPLPKKAVSEAAAPYPAAVPVVKAVA